MSLAPALLAKTRPEDTLFVFARAAEGPRMPLAILKKQVKDLPLAFTLDDSLAMSPSATLVDGAARGRRRAHQPHWQRHAAGGRHAGLSAPMAPGATGLKIQITEVVAAP